MQYLFLYAIYGIYAIPQGLDGHVQSHCSRMENFIHRNK